MAQKREPGVCRNASSSSLDTRARAALRWEKRPKRAITSRCRRAKSAVRGSLKRSNNVAQLVGLGGGDAEQCVVVVGLRLLALERQRKSEAAAPGAVAEVVEQRPPGPLGFGLNNVGAISLAMPCGLVCAKLESTEDGECSPENPVLTDSTVGPSPCLQQDASPACLC